MTVNRILFSDAEVLEDVVEAFLWGDLTAGDFGENVEDVAEVFAKQVATEAGVEAGDASLKGCLGAAEGFVVAGVGDDDV